jgi:hypothetical protein
MHLVRRASFLLSLLVVLVCHGPSTVWCGPLWERSHASISTDCSTESSSIHAEQAIRPSALLAHLLQRLSKPMVSDNPLFELPKIDPSNTSWQENWSFFIDKYVTTKPEEEISAGIHGYRGDAGLRYMISAGWGASFGMYVVQNMEAFKVLPLLGLEWNNVPGSKFSALVGLPETSLVYRITSSLSSRIGLRYDHGLSGLATVLFPEEQLVMPHEDLTAGLYLDRQTGPECLLTLGLQYSLYDDAAHGSEEVQSLGTFLRIVYSF